jgi:hypothetical protein
MSTVDWAYQRFTNNRPEEPEPIDGISFDLYVQLERGWRLGHQLAAWREVQYRDMLAPLRRVTRLLVSGTCPRCGQLTTTTAPKGRITWRGECPAEGCSGRVIARRIRNDR